jgi:hypothetical protein
MDKFKGYVGIAAALALAWLFLAPQSAGFRATRMQATPLDNTGISIIILGRSETYPLLARVETFVRQCPGGVEAEPRALDRMYGYKGDQCLFHHLAPGRNDLYALADDFGQYDTTFRNDLRTSFDMEVDSEAFKQLIVRMQERAVATYPKMMSNLHRSYVLTVYFWHALFVGVILLMLWFRREVGGVLLLPITGLGKLLAKAHEKV